MCKKSGWIEIGGCGMVHPAVFEAVGYDAEKYTGFAWGIGIERVAILRYQVEDIRLFYENDLRFLEQFPATDCRCPEHAKCNHSTKTTRRRQKKGSLLRVSS